MASPKTFSSRSLNHVSLILSLKNITEVYPGAAQMYGKGSTFMDEFDDDKHVAMREDNLYYPWASHPEWELPWFLLCSSLSIAAINQFLSLGHVSESCSRTTSDIHI